MFSAGSNCAYLCSVTQAMRRRKMDYELQGNKRSAQCWSSRTNARRCSVTPRSRNPGCKRQVFRQWTRARAGNRKPVQCVRL
ncbi:hypothetical protein Rleg9DRAFT_5333 [Rhizobium leguminosarum bv. trifolii WSM597]|uniref:Uncharacterized protein n=1 Tax=Rhizobium leguminosarum bv. trifolii WSM597 TaxID=754764 RepID=J0H821_RHILT|nr:hypothetical protein Rleg9DRAFT_5333 [Rhizobium leguminosarum bv. trifolii WSM597]